MNIYNTNYFRELDNNRNKFYYIRLGILDKNNKIIQTIEGRTLQGSNISINSNSNIRRTCNINMVAEDSENDLTNIDNLLSINKKIKIAIGIKTFVDFSKIINIDNNYTDFYIKGQIYYDTRDYNYKVWTGHDFDIISDIYNYSSVTWFPLGVFVIVQPTLTRATNNYTISLSCKDKMCLLNGEMGGGFPTSITFHEYNQIIGLVSLNTAPWEDTSFLPNDYTVYQYDNKYYMWEEGYGYKETDNSQVGKIVSKPQLIYDIIKTVVINYGMESASNIIINDVPIELKQLVRYTGSTPLYYNAANGDYKTDETQLYTEYTTTDDTQDPPVTITHPVYWEKFNYNEDVGYVYTDFTYPGTLITNIGDNVCTVLDKIKNTLGNYEYFYDIDGNFVFQEIKNYLNNSYIPIEKTKDTETLYLENARNFDWHCNEDGSAKEKWTELSTNNLRIIGEDNYKSDYYGNGQNVVYSFEEGNGLITSYSNSPSFSNIKNDFHIWGKSKEGYAIHYHLTIKEPPAKPWPEREVTFLKDIDGKYTGKIRLPKEGDNISDIVIYTASDWRAELYLQGLEIANAGNRPDIYQQELLDLFDEIYEWGYYEDSGEFTFSGRFKNNGTTAPNNLSYFFDYLMPVDKLYGLSVDEINTKTYSYQQDKIVKLYSTEVPNRILIDINMETNYKYEIMKKCDEQGQMHSLIPHNIYQKLSIGTIGYSADEVMRDCLYKYTNYNESITLQSIPIYYLDVNTRIAVRDTKTGIYGDYIIQSISLPLIPTSTMNITATRALQRI